MIVCKFGGTSVQDAEAMTRLAHIIRARRDKQPVVVASAMGKTTNQLLEAAQTAATGKRQEALDLLTKIKEKHFKEAQKMGIASQRIGSPKSSTHISKRCATSSKGWQLCAN